MERTYTIIINEEQRQALVTSLQKVALDRPHNEEEGLLLAMLIELPTVECTHSTVHGFAL